MLVEMLVEILVEMLVEVLVEMLVEITGCWSRSWPDDEFQGIKIYSRGRRGDRNQAKCSILIPDRDDRSVHEIWAANILSHINTKVIIPIQNIPISPTVNLSPQARLTFCMFRVQIKSHGNNRIIWRHKNLLNICTVIK